MKTTIQLIALIVLIACNVWMIFFATVTRRSIWFGHQIEQEVNPAYRWDRVANSWDSIRNPEIVPGDWMIDRDTAIHTYVWYKGRIVFATLRGTEYFLPSKQQWFFTPLDSAKAQCWREAERWIERETKEPDSITWIQFRFDSVTMITDTDTFRTKPTLIPTHD